MWACGHAKGKQIASLRWYGHVVRRETTEGLPRVSRMEVDERRQGEGPQETWINCVKEEFFSLNANKEDALDQKTWEQIIKRLTP